MKNVFKLIGIIALAAVIGFSMAACGGGGDDDDDPNGPGGGGGGGSSGSLGETFTLSDQVYTLGVDESAVSSGGNMYKYTPYTGPDRILTDGHGGTGSITDGKISFSVGVPVVRPGSQYFTTLLGGLGLLAKDVKLQPDDTQINTFNFEDIKLKKEYMESKLGQSSNILEQVMYLYVDRDCTITSNGGTDNSSVQKITYSKVNISLKKGWNVFYHTQTAATTNVTRGLVSGDSKNAKWVLSSR
jgi:hypothetical protein